MTSLIDIVRWALGGCFSSVAFAFGLTNLVLGISYVVTGRTSPSKLPVVGPLAGLIGLLVCPAWHWLPTAAFVVAVFGEIMPEIGEVIVAAWRRRRS